MVTRPLRGRGRRWRKSQWDQAAACGWRSCRLGCGLGWGLEAWQVQQTGGVRAQWAAFPGAARALRRTARCTVHEVLVAGVLAATRRERSDRKGATVCVARTVPVRSVGGSYANRFCEVDVRAAPRLHSTRSWRPLASRSPACSCGFSTSAVYDRSARRWRHLDTSGKKVFLQGGDPPLGLQALRSGGHRRCGVGSPRRPPHPRLR